MPTQLRPLPGGPMRARIVTLCAAPLALALTAAAPAPPMSAPISASVSGSPSWGHATTRFAQVDLVSDVKGRAALTDPKLVNPWGLAMGAALWVSDAGTGSATVYTGGAGTVKKAPTQVSIPGGTPTGQVAYSGDAFTIKGRLG